MKQLGLITLILIVMLGCIGVAYSSWSSDSNITGGAAAGSFDVIFNSFTAPDTISGAYFSATPDGSDPDHKYTITLNNLYPGLDAAFDFVLENTGAIPAKITDVKIDGASVTGTGYRKDKDLPATDSQNDVTISIQGITTSTGIAANASVSGHLTVHTWAISPDGSDATPGASGSFTFEIDVEQQ
jgi:hypothetical protein